MNDVVTIILTYNQLEQTRQCLNILLASGEVGQVLVWDNGSRDGTVERLHEQFPGVHVHGHPSNLGVAGGRNAAAALAIERYRPRYLLFLDNDILVEPGFGQALHKVLSSDERVGQVQAKLRFMHDRARLNDGGGARIDFLRWQITPVGFDELDQGQYDTIAPCISCGGAMMVRTEIFQQLSGFDMQFNPFGPEDLDFSLRLQKAGYRALYVPQAMGYHAVSHTFGKGYSEEYARHKAQHWFRFMRRHATPLQQATFFLLGAPYLAVRILLREGRRGNLGAVRGLARGVLDLARPAAKSDKEVKA